MSEGKGRPTPKRSEAQKRRSGPVAPPPTNRREAAKQLRMKQAAERQQLRQAGRTDDDRLLLPRDRGPVRGLVRDVVDARRSLGGLLLPTALLVFATTFQPSTQVKSVAAGIWLATMLGVVLDMVLAAVQIRSALKAQFPDEKRLGGHIGYGLLRTTVIRRFRNPKPRVQRGRKA